MTELGEYRSVILTRDTVWPPPFCFSTIGKNGSVPKLSLSSYWLRCHSREAHRTLKMLKCQLKHHNSLGAFCSFSYWKCWFIPPWKNRIALYTCKGIWDNTFVTHFFCQPPSWLPLCLYTWCLTQHGPANMVFHWRILAARFLTFQKLNSSHPL